MAKSGRVPKGCFLETNIPIADAVSKASIFYTPVITSASSQPIAVSNVITKSFSVVALVDYQGREEEELDLIRGDELQAFKRCNHWTYVRVPCCNVCAQYSCYRFTGRKSRKWSSWLGTGSYSS